MELSKRLRMVADMTRSCDLLMDVGTDHGYLPIYLTQKGTIKRAIASDVSKGSCEKAERNVLAHHLKDKIQVRCGNGLEVLAKDEMPDCIVMSGMGGMLAIDVLKSAYQGSIAPRLVLQVQRDIYAVRKHLHKTGYKIICEDMLKEDNKVYVAMAAVKGEDAAYTEVQYHFGKLLLESKNQILKEYIAYEHNKIINVLSSIEHMQTEETEERKIELKKLSNLQKEALECL